MLNELIETVDVIHTRAIVEKQYYKKRYNKKENNNVKTIRNKSNHPKDGLETSLFIDFSFSVWLQAINGCKTR